MILVAPDTAPSRVGRPLPTSEEPDDEAIMDVLRSLQLSERMVSGWGTLAWDWGMHMYRYTDVHIYIYIHRGICIGTHLYIRMCIRYVCLYSMAGTIG